jgi:hypothetical protein
MRQPHLRGFPCRDFLLDALLQGPAQFAKIVFESLSFGDVNVDADQARRLAGLANELRPRIHPAHAVRAADAMLEFR